MPLVLAGASSGTTTLQATDAVTTTITLPSTTGTIMVSGNMPAFSAYQSTAQAALAASTATKIQFQTEEFDTNSNFDNVTNYRFTPTVTGYYQINGAVQMSGTTTTLFASIYKNGTSYKGSSNTTVTSGNPQVVVSSIVYLNGTTDYVEFYATTASSLAPIATINGTYFNGAMIRSA